MSTCAAYDTAFRAAEQQISKDLIKDKNKLAFNGYWGRVKDNGPFPRNSGTRIKKIRLSSMGFNQGDVGWENIEDNGCMTNVCAMPLSEEVTHGSSDSYYSLERFRMATQPICLAMLPFREMPEEEILHMESQLHELVRYNWDDWLRTRYTNMVENKQVGFVSAQFLSETDPCALLDAQCHADITSDAFLFWNRGANNQPVLDSTFPMDERYVSVNVFYSSQQNLQDNIMRISELSGDWIETACMNLQYENANMPFFDEKIPLMDLVTADVRVARRMIQAERRQESECVPLVAYQGEKLSLSLGITHVIRDYIGMRWDRFAQRFYPDYAYNSALTSYSATDPATWPRFRRVYPFMMATNPNGTKKSVPNPDYLKSPFGISNIFSPMVMGMRSHPVAQSVGSARVGSPIRDYAGEVRWRNEYDKQCNHNLEIGFWEVNFGAGAEPHRPENGFSFFHRIDTSVKMTGVRCAPERQGCGPVPTTMDCYDTILSGETGTPGVTRGANLVSHDNMRKYFI